MRSRSRNREDQSSLTVRHPYCSDATTSCQKRGEEWGSNIGGLQAVTSAPSTFGPATAGGGGARAKVSCPCVTAAQTD